MLQIGAAVNFNEKIFPKPDVFCPERFLNLITMEYKSSEFLCPFGLGKRACLGENLARMELLIVFAGLLQNFEFLPINAGKIIEIFIKLYNCNYR